MVWVVVGAVDECRKSGGGEWRELDTLKMRDKEEGEIQGSA